jgi:hypothetical protein
MFLVQHKWPHKWLSRLVGFCIVLALVVGWVYRLQAQTRLYGASGLPAKTIETLKKGHGYFPTQWRRWPGTPAARPKKASPENIPRPRPTPPKKEEVQPTPPALDPNPAFPLDRFEDHAPGRQPRTQPLPFGQGSLPSEGDAPFDLNLDNAPKPPDVLKQPELTPPKTIAPSGDLKKDTAPFGDAPFGAARPPRGRYYQAYRSGQDRPSRGSRPSYSPRYQPGHARTLDPAARQRSRVDDPTYRRDPQARVPQGRQGNPLRSGTRTAASSAPQRVVPVANWSAVTGRKVHRAEPIRSSVPPRFNPLRP